MTSTATLEGYDQHLLRVFDSAAVPLALVVALAVGTLHGLAPGHGKSMTAAYLVGSHARHRYAWALAGIVAGMHTASVLALGLAWWLAADSGPVAIDSTTQWMQLVVALAVLTVGLVITRRRWHQRSGHHQHHDHHTSDADSPPWTRTGLVAIASVGGLLPSPSAFLVLVSGLLTDRAELAVAMVLSFGLGLATTVLVIGLLTITGRDWFARRDRYGHNRLHWLVTRMPLLGAAGVLIGGCVLTVAAVSTIVTT